MDLFHQTVSMKAVDNLNDFVRSHMLEPFDTRAQIDSLVEHFENLTRAHDAVVKAPAQLEQLTPIMGDLNRYEQTEQALAKTNREREALPYFFAERSRAALETELGRLGAHRQSLLVSLETVATTIAALRDEQQQLNWSRSGARPTNGRVRPSGSSTTSPSRCSCLTGITKR